MIIITFTTESKWNIHFINDVGNMLGFYWKDWKEWKYLKEWKYWKERKY